MKSLLYLTMLLVPSLSFGQKTGIFTNQTDIGSPKLKGSTGWNEADQSYQLKGGGYNIWFARDEFQYSFKKLKGNFLLTASFEFIGKGVDPHRKTGWMVRASTKPESAHVSAVVHGDGLTVLQWRTKEGAQMRDPEDEIFAGKKSYSTIQIERVGKTIIMRASRLNEALEIIGQTDAAELPEEVLVGLFICSHNADVTEEVRVWNVRVGK